MSEEIEVRSDSANFLFSFGIVLLGLLVLVLWRLLSPGYVFGLDMVTAPWFPDFVPSFGLYNLWPWWALQKGLSFLLPTWLVQKIIIVGVLVALAITAYKFLPIKKRSGRLWAAIFFLVNPFVYTRFLAGHLALLLGCAFLLPLLWHSTNYFWRGGKSRDAWLSCLWLLLIGAVSIHVLVMGCLMILGTTLCRLGFTIKDRKWQVDGRLLYRALLPMIIFLAVSCYWIVPYIFHFGSVTTSEITISQAAAFQTASDSRLGSLLNVLSLHGFWAENAVWGQGFLWAKNNLWLWIPLWLLILALVVVGVREAGHDRERRYYSATLLVLTAVAFVFSLGVGANPFRPLNSWLYSHFHYWLVFRDSTKWNIFLLVAYAYFGGVGLIWFLEKMATINRRLVGLIFWVSLLVPLLWTYPMLGGFSGQMKSVWYPESWFKAKAVLNSQLSNGVVLALPWHKYLSLPFNQNRISFNPARLFFGNSILVSGDMELAGESGEVMTSKTAQIGRILKDSSLNSMQRLIVLRQQQVVGFLVLNQLMGHDEIDYNWLNSKSVQLLFVSPEISVFRF